MDPKKIEAVQSWPRPTSVTEIGSFLGLTGYYRRFVQVFSSIVASLTRLTQKGAPFRWSDECEASFQKVKTALTTVPVLVLLSGSGMYTLKIYEKNYPMHNLELAVVVYARKILRHYLYGVSCQANVVAYALSRKAESMGSLAFISPEERPLALDIQSLANRIVRLDISEPSRVLACVVAQSSLLGQIKARFSERCLGKGKVDPGATSTAQSKQKSYAYQKTWDVSFMVGEKVLLKVLSMKGIMRFGKKGKLSPKFIGPFEVLRRVGEVAYELALPPSLLEVYSVFHVSMLRRYYADLLHVLDFSTIQLDESLGYEEEHVAIVDRHDHQLRSKRNFAVKVK
ncbi:uncharacterized protein [Nicotiana sylvestris]|uniref:uncharacterized protein n=1 Tax=Nicotiana sylvestris TaxID=4096 RepID=UPI00388CA6DD